MHHYYYFPYPIFCFSIISSPSKQHYDFETISKITNPFITPKNGFEEQFRKLAVKKVHNKLNDIKEEIPEHHIIYGKDIFEGIKIEEERNKHK